MIRTQTKRLTRSIYVMRCGYCGVSEAETGSELTYDHFQPQSKGGSDTKENIVYACHACNEFKSEYFGETETARLLHPLRDDLQVHIQPEFDGSLRGITPAGDLYIRVLNLNRPPLVARRKNRQEQGATAESHQAIDARLDAIIERIQRIEERMRFRRR